MKCDSYIVVQGWMVTELNLSGTELLIFAIIYGFSQDGVSCFEGSWSYLAEWANASKSTVYRTLKNLLDKGYITKTERSAGYIEYRAIRPSQIASESATEGFQTEYVGELTQEQINGIIDLWNAQKVTRNIDNIKPMSKRYDRLRRLLLDFSLSELMDVIRSMDDQGWFVYEAERGGFRNFDWFCDSDVITRIKEGTYSKRFLAKGEIDWSNA